MSTSPAPAPGQARPSLLAIAPGITGYDPQALAVEQARECMARFVHGIEAVEKVALRSALGRVLAANAVSAIDVPAHDNSAMDGYALRGADLSAGAPLWLRLVGSAAVAGSVPTIAAGPGECVRIMTGAVMPVGLDTVLPQEFARLDGTQVEVPANILAWGDNRRRRGEDLARGEVALPAGRVLKPADLGLLASLGQAEVAVRRRLRVAFFSTGDELRSIGEPLDPGCVYDSNRYTLYGMLTRLGFDPIDMGVVRDDPAALEAALRSACGCADAVITSGGVSVGEADHTRQVIARRGEVAFWRIAMRPGRPMAFGRVASDTGSAVLFGLPGNPVAAMVSFYALVRDALLAMAGATPQPLPVLRARATGPIPKKPGRTEYPRGIIRRASDGDWDVALTGAQGSGILRSMSEANALVVLPHASGPVEPGSRVDAIPFDALV